MKYSFLVLFLLFSLSACQTDDTSQPPASSQICEFLGIVDGDELNNTNSDNYFIQNVEIEGDCLQIELSSSGCSGATWVVNLFGSDITSNSLPPIRSIAIQLQNSEDCEAFITKTYSFELTQFKSNGDSIFLMLDDWDDRILYSH